MSAFEHLGEAILIRKAYDDGYEAAWKAATERAARIAEEYRTSPMLMTQIRDTPLRGVVLLEGEIAAKIRGGE